MFNSLIDLLPGAGFIAYPGVASAGVALHSYLIRYLK